MVLSPPTPPPTSTTELRDAARAQETVENAAQSSLSQGSTADPYQMHFPGVVDLVSRSDYQGLVQFAEERDSMVQYHVLSRYPCALIAQ